MDSNGLIYEFGLDDDVPKNIGEAVMWYRKAAELGDGFFAASELAGFYANGIGVVQNDVEACCWYLIAAASGDEDSTKGAAKLRERMTRGEYASAQEKATAWIESHKNDEGKATEGGKTTGKIVSSGTGFFITSDGYFVTCSHVVNGGKTIKVRVAGKEIAASIIGKDSANDLALLKVEGKDFAALPIRQDVPEMGNHVSTIGFPIPDLQGNAAKFTDGVISSLSGINDDVHDFQITVPVQPGNSGGPLFDDTGNVVGIVVAKMNAVAVFNYTGDIPQNVNFAVKAGYTAPLIQNVPGLAKRLLPVREKRPGRKPVEDVGNATAMVLVYK